MPLQGFAQQNSVALAAKTDAEYDAEDDVNTALWLVAGGILGTAGSCLLGSVAMVGLISISRFRRRSDFSVNRQNTSTFTQMPTEREYVDFNRLLP